MVNPLPKVGGDDPERPLRKQGTAEDAVSIESHAGAHIFFSHILSENLQCLISSIVSELPENYKP